jgi:hypothetical protein
LGTVPLLELSWLSDKDCWELFKQRAFGPNEVERADLVVIGKEILKKCGGVPLAAIALGSLLRFKREEKQWLFVKESKLWGLQGEDNVMPALRLSYLNLPIKLRQCFSFCALFPKDAIISKQLLIELWMPNGYISSNQMRLGMNYTGDHFSKIQRLMNLAKLQHSRCMILFMILLSLLQTKFVALQMIMTYVLCLNGPATFSFTIKTHLRKSSQSSCTMSNH